MYSRKEIKMYFMQNDRLREMEKLMQCVPNFRPRGCGVISIRNTEIPPSTFAEVIMETASAIRYRPFQLRLHQYLKESKDSPMIYKNDKHRLAFEAAVRKENKKNYALLSALYLLTADGGLWRDTKRFVISGYICFEQVHMPNCTETAYALFCTAKDLYFGTKHLTVSDLADQSLIPPNPEKECILSDILEADVPEKYYLSQKQMERLLFKLSPEHRESVCTQTAESESP